MCDFLLKESWLDIARAQEEGLTFDSFDRMDALSIGMRIIELSKNKYKGNVVISIIEDDMLVFYHKMADMTPDKDIWIKKKLNICRSTGVSSFRAALELKFGKREVTWQGREDAYVACGGCWPIVVSDKQTYAYITVSGLEHYDDHQIIVDALSEYMDRTVPSLT